MSARMFMGIPREQLAWAPRVDTSLCIGCGDCVEFCPNGVFVMNSDTGTVEVGSPDQCVVLCDKCAASCSQDAISFPDKDEMKRHLRRLLLELRQPPVGTSPATEKKGRLAEIGQAAHRNETILEVTKGPVKQHRDKT